MISLAKVLHGKPIVLNGDIYLHQPTLYEIVEMGEQSYWSLINLWLLKRRDMINTETEQSLECDDYTIWKLYIFSSPILRKTLSQSCEIFFKSKVEFFDISGTIYIGEKGSGVILDETFYLLAKEYFSKIVPESSASDEGQYHETDNMSEREKQMIEKMKSSAQKIETINNPNKKPEDYLGNRILGLVAVGGYTFDQVYNMTMLQFNVLLQKYVDIQSFELRTSLSPYISSDDGHENKFWLD